MLRSPERFAQLLTTAIRTLAAREGKNIATVQDDLGYALGRQSGGSCIEYWRKRHLPAREDLWKLAEELRNRGGLEREGYEELLHSAGVPLPVSDRYDAVAPAADASRELARREEPVPAGDLSPFVVGPPVVVPRQFFGRNRELKRIFGWWRSFPLEHVAIIGPKRSGKSSLLHYLRNVTRTPPAELRPGQRWDWLHEPARYRFTVVDFQDPRMGKLDSLLRHLLQSLRLPVPEPCDLSRFMDIIGEGLRDPAIVLMDEIEAGLASPELDERFWWSLRSLAGHEAGGRLAFLLTGHASPFEVARDQGKPSPFFNIFHTIKLGPFTDEEARELVSSSPRPFGEEDRAFILEHGRGWPCLLQILCQGCFRAAEEGRAGGSWREEALRDLEPFGYLLEPSE